jgi:hypothetical protein
MVNSQLLLVLSQHHQILHALSIRSTTAHVADVSDASSNSHMDAELVTCAKVFDPLLTRWTVFCLTDALGNDIGRQRPEVLLRAWTPHFSIPEVSCLELDQYLERLYGVQYSSGSYIQIRKHSRPLEDSISTTPSKHLRIDILSIEPTHARQPSGTMHIMSSPGPIDHDDDESYLRVPLTTCIPTSCQQISDVLSGTINASCSSINQDIEKVLLNFYLGISYNLQFWVFKLQSLSMSALPNAQVGSLPVTLLGKVGTVFPSYFYFCDLYLGAMRYSQLCKSSVKANNAFAQIFPTVWFAESTWSKVRRQFRQATDLECQEWVAKGCNPDGLYRLFVELVSKWEYVRESLPWDDLSRHHGQIIVPPTIPTTTQVQIDDKIGLYFVFLKY